jgi:hypothetical protein
MEEPVLTAIRWKIGEFLFVEYLEGDAILIDLGPFPSNPADEQLEEACAYLAKAQLSFFTPGELEWVLDLDKLASAFPALQPIQLHGMLTHPAAFEVTSRPAPRRFFDKGLPVEGFYFLRISFDLEQDKTIEEGILENPEPSESSTDVPKFIS